MDKAVNQQATTVIMRSNIVPPCCKEQRQHAMEPSGHCPYLGLKQNRAIRFASPTPEHRCYVSGDAIDIPVDQASFCLAQGHVQCPLYTGSMVPTIDEPPIARTLGQVASAPAPAGTIRSWLGTLPPRDRAVYALMVGMLGLILAIYLFAGAQSLLGSIGQPTPAPIAGVTTAQPTVAATHVPSPVAATPTALPTTPPTRVPTAAPTAASIMFPPTAPATVAPTDLPGTALPTAMLATSAPAATTAATSAPPNKLPTSAPIVPTRPAATATATPAPTQPPVVNISTALVTLYFGDATGSLYVPIQREVRVENDQVANAAVRALIDGPRSALQPLLLSTAKLRDLRVENGTAVVNFDRRPTGAGDTRGFYAIALTLTQFPAIRQVQIQINDQNIGIDGVAPISRPTLNPLNPDGLANDARATEFLPLYFPLSDGTHDVRIIRLVPKTRETAQATLTALLDGPGSYGYAVQRVIPEGTTLRGVVLDPATRVLTVDFSQEFAAANNREAAVRNVVQSLTTLPNIRGAQILVEGSSLANQWGEAYRNGFGKPVINPE